MSLLRYTSMSLERHKLQKECQRACCGSVHVSWDGMREEIRHKGTIDKKMHPHSSTTLYIKNIRALPQTSSLSPCLTPWLTAWTSTWTKMDPGFSGDAGLGLSAPPCPTHLVFLHRSYGWRRKVKCRWKKSHAGVRWRPKRSLVTQLLTRFSAASFKRL